MNKMLSWRVGCLSAVLVAVGCGGNSPVSNLNPSSSPVQFSAQAGQIYIPDTSIALKEDIGLRSHTNHIIFFPEAKSFAGPSGLSPAQLRSAYGVPATGGSGVIAIVDAYNYATALNDFNVFATQFGLPKETSTNVTASTNQVFQVVYASGTKPTNNGGWAQEMALDIEWAHAMAPNAKIVLVEAASNSNANLIQAENVAKSLAGVKQVSNSWGGTESASLYTSYDSVFVQPNVVFFASGGDTGGQRNWPALSSNVVAVGGTTLKMSGTTYLGETAWSGTGCGPSAYEARPAFQSVVQGLVGTHRGSDDISAIADPNTGVSVYDSTAVRGVSGWLVFGGTSVACPVVAGIANNSGVTHTGSQDQNEKFYASIGSSSYHDVLSGTAGSFSSGTGWDFPTGVGTPNGLTGF